MFWYETTDNKAFERETIMELQIMYDVLILLKIPAVIIIKLLVIKR